MRLPRLIMVVLAAAVMLSGCGLDQYVAQTVRGLRAEDYFTDETTQAVATAVCDGNTEEVKRLVADGADPDVQGNNKILPLEFGMKCTNLVGVQALLDAGADPDLSGEFNTPVLHTASTSGLEAFLDVLLMAGADPEIRNSGTDQTTLMIAVGYQPAFDRLMLEEPDVNATSLAGGGAIHAAARTNRGAAILALLKAGADPEASSSGTTFQEYYFSFPRNVLNERSLAERQAIVAWLDAHDIPVDPRAR